MTKISKFGRRIKINQELQLNISCLYLLNKLKEKGFVSFNIKINKWVSHGITVLVNLDHADILRFYNRIILGLVNYYSFATNFSQLSRVLFLLKQSCAKTLALKFKLKTSSKVFAKFGRFLTFKCSNNKSISLINPNLRRIRVIKQRFKVGDIELLGSLFNIH